MGKTIRVLTLSRNPSAPTTLTTTKIKDLPSMLDVNVKYEPHYKPKPNLNPIQNLTVQNIIINTQEIHYTLHTTPCTTTFNGQVYE